MEMKIMYKWYLIYSYHDLFMCEFNSDWECIDYLEHLKEEYRNDSDFHWQVIKGISLEKF